MRKLPFEILLSIQTSVDYLTPVCLKEQTGYGQKYFFLQYDDPLG